MASTVFSAYQTSGIETGSDASAIDENIIGKDVGSPGVLLRCHSRDDDGRPKRTGNLWTAAAHIITAVIGSGILSLPWSMSQLGWIVGPIILMGFSLVTHYTSRLLADCYRSPHPVTGRRNYTYGEAVRTNLGGWKFFVCCFAQYLNLFGTTIGYTITASISMVAIRRSNCFHEEGTDSPCHVSNTIYMAIFGISEIVFSQIPNFSKTWWLSIVAAIMSFSYSTIGFSLAVARATGKNHSRGTLKGNGIQGVFSDMNQTWTVFQALGNLAFAYSFPLILIEIQDTVKSPPPENQTMKRATSIAVVLTTVFYMSLGCIGYAAFGNNAPGNLLTGFGFYNPFWLVDIANACIVIHLVGAYQVYAQPLFAFIEDFASRIWTSSKFIHKEYEVEIPCIGPINLNYFRLAWRTCFVLLTTLISMVLPFFNDVLGILGALVFFPLSIYFPTQMYMAQHNIPRWTLKWTTLYIMTVVCLAVSSAALVGSIAGVVNTLKQYTPFKTKY